jgi:uncharacterized protein YxjI
MLAGVRLALGGARERTSMPVKGSIMRYVMKQKLFACGDDFTIKTEDGRDAFFVHGKAFSFGDVLILASTVVIDMVCHEDKKR